MANFINDTVFKKTLYNYTLGCYNDSANMQGLFLAPIVRTPTVAGYIQTYSDIDAFQTVDTSRQPGQSARVVTFKGTPVAYNMTPNALDCPIDQALIDMDDQESAMIHYETNTKYLVSVAHNTLEQTIWNQASASVSLTTGYGSGWSAATGSQSTTANPINEVEELYYTIASDIGVAPNRMICGSDAWRYMKQAFTTKGMWPNYMNNDAQLKDYYSNIGQGIQIKVAFAGYSQNPGQATRTITPFLGKKEIWLFYASENPTLLDRSAFKTLQYGTGLSNLRTYKTQDQRTTMLALDWYVDAAKFTNPYAVKRILVT